MGLSRIFKGVNNLRTVSGILWPSSPKRRKWILALFPILGLHLLKIAIIENKTISRQLPWNYRTGTLNRGAKINKMSEVNKLIRSKRKLKRLRHSSKEKSMSKITATMKEEATNLPYFPTSRSQLFCWVPFFPLSASLEQGEGRVGHG